MGKASLNGLSKHPLYQIYFKIIERCENPKRREYKWYGGAGVKMCPEWRGNFILFYEWALSHGWRKDLCIDKDKIPRELGIPALLYSPEMCSVITKKENMNAMSTNIVVEYLGRKQTLSQWADEFNVNYKLFWRRLNLGWDIGRALSSIKTDVRDTNSNKRIPILNTETGIFYFGFKEAAESIGMKENTLYGKIHERRRCKNDTPFIIA